MKFLIPAIFILFFNIACSQESTIDNSSTTSRNSNQLVLDVLINDGDNLEKDRRVDHWLYFPTNEDRQKCKLDLINLGYKIESEGLLKGDGMPFELHIWKIESVKLINIDYTTNSLISVAQKYNGDYDGWETEIVKE